MQTWHVFAVNIQDVRNWTSYVKHCESYHITVSENQLSNFKWKSNNRLILINLLSIRYNVNVSLNLWSVKTCSRSSSKHSSSSKVYTFKHDFGQALLSVRVSFNLDFWCTREMIDRALVRVLLWMCEDISRSAGMGAWSQRSWAQPRWAGVAVPVQLRRDMADVGLQWQTAGRQWTVHCTAGLQSRTHRLQPSAAVRLRTRFAMCCFASLCFCPSPLCFYSGRLNAAPFRLNYTFV